MGTIVLGNRLDRLESEILQDLRVEKDSSIRFNQTRFPLIPIANKRHVVRSSITQPNSVRSEVGQKMSSQQERISLERELSSLVPMCKGEGNSGALSLEPFEMSGLNFQVSVYQMGTGRTGEKKE